MPLQPNIALQVQGLQLPDPLAQSGRVAQIQNALQQQRMGEMQIQNAMREQRRTQELESLMAGFSPEAPAPEVARKLQERGFFQQAGQTLQQAALRDKTAREAQAARFTEIKTKAELAGRIFSGVSDQGSYTAARTRAIQQGLATADEIPEAYDKAAVDRIVRNAIDVPKALELQLKERATAAQEAQASAASTRAQAAVSQALTAADRAKFERENPGFTIQETDQGVFKVNKRTGVAEPLMVDGKPLQASAKGSRPQLLMLQDALADLEAAGQGDTERAQQIRNQIRASTSKGAVELSPKDIQAREAKYPQATLALRTFDEKTDELISDLKTLKNHPGLSGITGLIAGRTPAVTGDARNAKAILDKILARGGFQELQNLRNASPTGGALGQVSNTENQFLRQAFGTLDPVQDTKDFKRGVDQVIRELEGSKSRVRDAYDLTYEYRAGQAPAAPGESRSATRRGTALGAESGAPAEVKSDADYDKLPSGTMFKGPDGVLRRKP
jgi:hypothetical protein